MFSVVILSYCIFLASSQVISQDREDEWQEYMKKHEKSYNCEVAKAKARSNFLANIEEVDKHNSAYAAGNVSYRKALYHFSDMHHKEVLNMLCGAELPKSTRALSQTRHTSEEAASLFPEGPASIDWRSSLLPVLDQKRCGCCWAFTAVAQVESLYKRLIPSWSLPFSQQYLVDCSEGGCRGGWPIEAFDYMKANGVVPEIYYPYIDNQSDCGPTSKLIIFPLIKETFDFRLNGNESMLKRIVASEGPVAIGFQTNKDFLHYESGVFEDPTCSEDCNMVPHTMLLVGYGTDDTYKPPKDYWLIRNSWGVNWGEDGYARVIRNKGASCNAACYAMYTT